MSISPWAIAALLLGICTAARLPFFFRANINWDEATFILVGQSILDGHLPYVELWEVKPPLAFVPFALLISLFGKSIVAIRFGGMLFLAGAAFLTYLIGRKIWSGRAGVIAAISCIIFVGTIRSGQATMTEILAILPLMGALAVLVAKEHTTRVLFAAGFLLGVAGMIRLNLAYVALFTGIYLVFSLRHCSKREAMARLLVYVAGGLLPVVLTAVPYVLAGHADIWIRSVIVAPLKYANTGASFIQVVLGHVRHLNQTNALLWVGFLVGAGWLAASWSRQTSQQKRGTVLIGVFFLGTAWSIATSGQTAGAAHYMIQLVPFMSLMAGFTFDRLLATRYRLGAVGLMGLGLLAPVAPVVEEYHLVAKRVLAGKPPSHGWALEIAAVLTAHNPDRQPMYLMREHTSARHCTSIFFVSPLTISPHMRAIRGPG